MDLSNAQHVLYVNFHACKNLAALYVLWDSFKLGKRFINLSKFEVNEICWNNDGDYFFLTTGLGTLQVLSYPDVQKSGSKSTFTATG